MKHIQVTESQVSTAVRLCAIGCHPLYCHRTTYRKRGDVPLAHGCLPAPNMQLQCNSLSFQTNGRTSEKGVPKNDKFVSNSVLVHSYFQMRGKNQRSSFCFFSLANVYSAPFENSRCKGFSLSYHKWLPRILYTKASDHTTFL